MTISLGVLFFFCEAFGRGGSAVRDWGLRSERSCVQLQLAVMLQPSNRTTFGCPRLVVAMFFMFREGADYHWIYCWTRSCDRTHWQQRQIYKSRFIVADSGAKRCWSHIGELWELHPSTDGFSTNPSLELSWLQPRSDFCTSKRRIN